MFNRLTNHVVRHATTFRTPINTTNFLFPQPVTMFRPLNMMFAQQPSPMIMPFSPLTRMMATARTYQPSVKRRKSKHGFLKRLESNGGRKVIVSRRKKGRWQIGM